jgi:hypothetical protein
LGIIALKKAITVYLVIIGLVLLLFVGVPKLMSWIFMRSQNQTYEAIRKVTLPCPLGTTQRVEPWGEAGFLVACRKGEIMHGPWQGWEKGHLSVEGEFFEGKESGTCLIYTDDGKLYKTIKYGDAR